MWYKKTAKSPRVLPQQLLPPQSDFRFRVFLRFQDAGHRRAQIRDLLPDVAGQDQADWAGKETEGGRDVKKKLCNGHAKTQKQITLSCLFGRFSATFLA
jgi:hypothetical protein